LHGIFLFLKNVSPNTFLLHWAEDEIKFCAVKGQYAVNVGADITKICFSSRLVSSSGRGHASTMKSFVLFIAIICALSSSFASDTCPPFSSQYPFDAAKVK